MRIAFIIFSLSNQSGGTTTSLLNLYKSLSQTVEIDIYAGHKPNETVHHAFLNKENIFVFEAKTSWWYCPELKDRLIEKINGYDLIHIHGIWTYPSYIASKLALQFNKPYIISTHGMLESYAFQTKRWKKSPYWYLFQKNLLLKACSIHTISF